MSARLIQELQAVVGAEYVIHRPEDLIVYEYDASIDAAVPLAVVLPESAGQVADVVRIAREHGAPIVPRGAGTGFSGGAIAGADSLVLGMARLNRILEIDAENMLATVEPGVVNLELSEAAGVHGLYYAPDPSSQQVCTIGGNVAENSGGPHCLAYGVTTNHVVALEIVKADGSVEWIGSRSRETTGYDLRAVVIGSEGTLAVVTKVVVRLLRKPEAVRTLLAVYSKMEEASAAVSGIIAAGIVPAAVEMMDALCIRAVEPAVNAGYPADAEAVLLVEVDGLRETVDEESREIEEVCREFDPMEVRTATDAEERARLWAGRKGAIGALGRLAPNYYLLDGTIPRTRLMEAMDGIEAISERAGLPIANVLHAGDGNLHPCILFDVRDEDRTARAVKAGGSILELCVALGGVLSGEHGIGLEKQQFMPLMFTHEDMDAMSRLKPAFCAGDMLNPGKVFPKGSTFDGFDHSTLVARAGPGAYV